MCEGRGRRAAWWGDERTRIRKNVGGGRVKYRDPKVERVLWSQEKCVKAEPIQDRRNGKKSFATFYVQPNEISDGAKGLRMNKDSQLWGIAAVLWRGEEGEERRRS